MATPIWNVKKKRWELDETRNGVRKLFTSNKPLAPGLREIRKRHQAWLLGETDKSTWRLDKCWPLYLEDVKSRNGDGESYIQREKYGRLYILPALGLKRVGQISDQNWQDVINSAKGTRVAELSKKTLVNVRATITDFSRFAKKSRMIEARPEDLYVPKDAPVIGKAILQPDAVRTVLTTSCDAWYHNAHLLMVMTGFRPGEIYGLRPGDIVGNVMTIRQAVNSRRKITPGKNKRAQRRQVLHPAALIVLANQRRQLIAAGFKDSPWIFPAQSGERPSPSRSYKQWKAFAKPLGITVPPYSLRHTFHSVTKGKLPLAWSKMILGHGVDMDTDGVYGQEVEGELIDAAVIIGGIFADLMKPKTELLDGTHNLLS